MNKKVLIVISYLACIALLLFAARAIALRKKVTLDQTNRILIVKGDVKIKRAKPGAAWQKAEPSTVLETGDIIETAEGSTVDVVIGNNTDKAVRLEEKSSMAFQQINPAYLDLSKGKAMVALKKLKPRSSFVIKTPTAICGAKGTGWSTVSAANSTKICVFDGEVFVRELNVNGRPKIGQHIAREGTQVILQKDKPIVKSLKIGQDDISDWKYWHNNISFLRQGKLLINDFDKKENFNNIGGPFGSWNVFYSDTSQYCKDEFTPLETMSGKGYSLKLSYDVEAQFSAYNGFFTSLMGMDISDYKYLVFHIKGDKWAGFTTKVNLELKNKFQTGKTTVDGIMDQWKKIVIPLDHFAGINSFKEMKELVIVFSDLNVTRKVGVVYIDDIYFSKDESDSQ